MHVLRATFATQEAALTRRRSRFHLSTMRLVGGSAPTSRPPACLSVNSLNGCPRRSRRCRGRVDGCPTTAQRISLGALIPGADHENCSGDRCGEDYDVGDVADEPVSVGEEVHDVTTGESGVPEKAVACV